jgi:hypothetical protein
VVSGDSSVVEDLEQWGRFTFCEFPGRGGSFNAPTICKLCLAPEIGHLNFLNFFGFGLEGFEGILRVGFGCFVSE